MKVPSKNNKKNKSNIEVQGTSIAIFSQGKTDYISLTDMVQNFDGKGALIEQWLKSKDSVLFLGAWERINNPDFNSLEFEGIKNEAGRNSFYLSATEWRAANPKIEGNIRDQALLEQLVVLSNLESINSVLIRQGLSQFDRLQKLNEIAITQMRSILKTTNVKSLEKCFS